MGGNDRIEHAGYEAPERAYHIKNDAGRPDRQVKEIGALKPFDKNKRAVLAALSVQPDETVLPVPTIDKLINFYGAEAKLVQTHRDIPTMPTQMTKATETVALCVNARQPKSWER